MWYIIVPIVLFAIFVCVAVYCCFLCCVTPFALKDKKKKKKEQEGPHSVHTFKEKGDDINDAETVYDDEIDVDSQAQGGVRSLYEAQRDFIQQLYMRRTDNDEFVTAEASVINDREDIDQADMDAIKTAIAEYSEVEDFYDPESPNRRSQRSKHFDADVL